MSDMMEELNQEQIEFLNKYAEEWDFNKETGKVDCGNLYCNFKNLSSLLGIRFGVCRRDFSIYDNQFTSLEGCPEEVGGRFDIGRNILVGLIGCPKKIGGTFNCTSNFLKSLEGCPEEIGESFHCSSNALTNLNGGPKRVGSSYYCYSNILVSLNGCPEIIDGNFSCSDNLLINLVGGPKKIKDNFECKNNWLDSLEGCPESIGGWFNLYGNNIKGLEYLFAVLKDLGEFIDFGSCDMTNDIFRSISDSIKDGGEYRDVLVNLWSKFDDRVKKFLVNDLPVDGLGKVIRRVNKFGMNI